MSGIHTGQLIDPFHRRLNYLRVSVTDRCNLRCIYCVPEAPFQKLDHVPRGRNDGPAERYRFKGAKGEIGLICAVSRHFCDQCNRLRLTSDGRLRSCLFSESSVDLKTPLRRKGSLPDLARLFFQAARHKPLQHVPGKGALTHQAGRMCAIGG